MIRFSRKTTALTAAALAIVVAAVALVVSWPASVSRQKVAANLADRVIVPAYQTFASQTAKLEEATASLCESPSAKRLEAARSAWKEARSAWKRTEAHQFGPAMRLRIDSLVDFYPSRPWDVKDVLQATMPLDGESVKGLGASARGFPALEIVLFGEPSTVLTKASAADGRTCRYVTALATDLDDQAKTLVERWSDPDDGHAKMMATASAGNRRYDDVQQVIDDVVNELIGLSHMIEDDKLGRPLGKRHGNMKQPEAVESRISGHGVKDMIANVKGMRAVYTCPDGQMEKCPGLDDLVKAVDSSLDEKMKSRLERLQTALEKTEGNLSEVVTEAPGPAATAFERAVALNETISTQLVTALSVTPTFSDNDGD